MTDDYSAYTHTELLKELDAIRANLERRCKYPFIRQAFLEMESAVCQEMVERGIELPASKARTA